MAIRPRLMVASLLVSVGVSLPLGWALWRVTSSASSTSAGIEQVVLSEPGEFEQPVDQAMLLPGVLPSPVPLPVIPLVDARGREVSTEDLFGRPAVINIWFSTCPPCERELPDFAEVHREVGDRIRFIGVNPFDAPEVMTRFAAERGVAYEQWRDPQSAFIDAVATAAFPRTLFVDAAGRVVADTGVLTATELRTLIAAVL